MFCFDQPVDDHVTLRTGTRKYPTKWRRTKLSETTARLVEEHYLVEYYVMGKNTAQNGT